MLMTAQEFDLRRPPEAFRFSAHFDFMLRFDIARDPEYGVKLSYTHGRSRAGTGHTYILYIPKQPDWMASKHLRIKAHSDEEALHIARLRLSTRYDRLHPIDIGQLCLWCRESLEKMGRIQNGAQQCHCTWEGWEVPIQAEPDSEIGANPAGGPG